MVLAEIFGPDLLIVVIVIAVVIFGGAAIPKLARSLGSAKTEFSIRRFGQRQKYIPPNL